MASTTLEGFLDVLQNGDTKEIENTSLCLKGASRHVETLNNLARLKHLGLLNDTLIFSLLAHAPLDPLGIFELLSAYLTAWEFNPHDLSVMFILAKEKDQPIALLQVDLLTNAVNFYANKDGELHLYKHISEDALYHKTYSRHELPTFFQAMVRETISVGKGELSF